MHRRDVVMVLTAGVLLAASVAAQEIYRWIDRSGRTHFTDDLSKVPAEYRKQMETRPATPPRQMQAPASSEAPASQPARTDDAPTAPGPLSSSGRAPLPPVAASHIQELRLDLKNTGGQITGALVFVNADGHAVAIQDETATLTIQCGRTQLYHHTWTVQSGDFRPLQTGGKTIVAVPLAPITSFGEHVCLGAFGEATVEVASLRATARVTLHGLF